MKNLESMNGKEWKSYKKEMKMLEKRHKKFPESKTVEEIRELTDYYWESTRRLNLQTEKIQKATWVFVGITIVASVVSIIFSILGYFKKKDRAEKIAETTAPVAEAIAATNAYTDIFLDSFVDISED